MSIMNIFLWFRVFRFSTLTIRFKRSNRLAASYHFTGEVAIINFTSLALIIKILKAMSINICCLNWCCLITCNALSHLCVSGFIALLGVKLLKP